MAKSPIRVDSRYHQTVTRKTLGCPPVSTAFSSGEDIIEGIEKRGQAWVVGVQWHPERIEDNIGDTFLVLFRDFISSRSRIGRIEIRMAIKNHNLYSSLWASCDEPDVVIEVTKGGSFADMVDLKGDKEIAEKISKIISKLAEANDLVGVIDVADFQR